MSEDKEREDVMENGQKCEDTKEKEKKGKDQRGTGSKDNSTVYIPSVRIC
jgi:hypothetical protein